MNRAHRPSARAASRRGGLLQLPLVGALWLATAPLLAAAETPARIHNVIIQAVAYQPPVLVVHRGDVVIWTNKDPFAHNVRSTQGFRSPDIAPGASWRFVARRRGEYHYGCTLHETMAAVLRVE